MSESTDPSKETKAEDSEDSIDTKINLAVRAQLKRELKPVMDQLGGLKGLDQTIAAAVSRAMEAKPEEAKQSKKEDGKVDPAVKLLQEQLEKLTKKHQEAEDKARALEQKSRREGIRSQLREALEAKGIKGARAAALISHLESTAIKDDGERVEFSSSRSRSKGSPVEELLFDSIQAGVEDWAKTPDAAEFLPAPTTPAKAASHQSQAVPAPRRIVTRQQSAALTDQEMAKRTAQQLESMGVNINAVLNE